eukprot:3710943-Rhodomonas_salina.1
MSLIVHSKAPLRFANDCRTFSQFAERPALGNHDGGTNKQTSYQSLSLDVSLGTVSESLGTRLCFQVLEIAAARSAKLTMTNYIERSSCLRSAPR